MILLIEKLIQKRNPNFKFDEEIDSYVLFSLIFDKLICYVRGFRLLIYFKHPPFLLLGSGVRFFNLPKIKMGKWVKLDKQVYLSALGSEGISIGDNVGLGAYSRLIVSTSFNNVGKYIRIGNNVGIGEFAYLGGAGGLEIGDDCIIGQYLSCHPENHNFADYEELIRDQGTVRKGIIIGNNCWIGSKVTILDGVVIGAHSVISAGAVVTKSMPEYSIIGGVPARILKMREKSE